MDETFWRDGIRLATGRSVARLPQAQVQELLALIEAHAGPSLTGQALLEWVRDIAAKWARHELAQSGGRFGFRPGRCSDWLTAGMPDASAPLSRGRPVQPFDPGADWLPDEFREVGP